MLKSRFDVADMRGTLKSLLACPLIIVCNTLLKSLVMSAALILSLILAEVITSALRKIISEKTRFAFLLLIAAFSASVTEILFTAYLNEAATSLGVYLPLLAVSCIIVMRLEDACTMTPVSALADATVCGAEFAGIAVCIGLLREIIGLGTIGSGFFGDGGIKIFHESPLPILSSSAGALLIMSLTAALMKYIGKKKSKEDNGKTV